MATNGSGPSTATRPRPSPPITDAWMRVPVVRARRRGWLAALSLVLVLLGALGVVWLVGALGQRTPVLVLARDVAYGATITDADLSTADVAADPGIHLVPVTQRAAIVGLIATRTLTAGSLLAPSDVAAGQPPAAGQVLVGIAVPATRMPAVGLNPGDQVLVVDTPAADADPPTSAPASIPATVVGVGVADLNGTTVIDVTTPLGSGPQLASWAATGRIAVVLAARGPVNTR